MTACIKQYIIFADLKTYWGGSEMEKKYYLIRLTVTGIIKGGHKSSEEKIFTIYCLPTEVEKEIQLKKDELNPGVGKRVDFVDIFPL